MAKDSSNQTVETIDAGGVELLEGFVPAPANDRVQASLAVLTKYGKAGEGMRQEDGSYFKDRFKLSDTVDVVAVYDQKRQTSAILQRVLEREQQLSGGRTRRIYKVVGVKVIGKGAEARIAALDEMAVRHEANQAVIEAEFPDGWV